MSKDSENNNVLQYLLLGKKGGKTSAKIIEMILVRPYNPNQLAKQLGMTYNTVQRHMKIMQKYKLLEKKSSGYGSIYEATPKLIKDIEKFNELKKLI